MKTININQISTDKGLALTLTAKDQWLTDILNNILPTKQFEAKTLVANLKFVKTNANVDIFGTITFTHKPQCARCGYDLSVNENIEFSAHLAPAQTARGHHKKGKGNEELELTKEDLDYCFYENDQINLESILNDEIALEIKYNYYCNNEKECQLRQPFPKNNNDKEDIDPRWAPLKKLNLS